MKVKWLIPILFALFGWYLVGGNFDAKLGMIDDHEIAMFLGSDGKVAIGEFPQLLMSTEVGQYGEYLRFRPVYYALRIKETMLWRDNATRWYGARYTMLVAFMLYLYQILKKFFPRIVSFLTVLYLMTLPFWADLLTRLGPSEVYAMVGLPMFVWAMTQIMGGKPSRLDWVQLGAGYLLSVGSKENFLVLWPVLLLVAIVRIWQKRAGKAEIGLYLGLTAITIWIAGAIVVATGRVGADIYATSISYPARIKWFFIKLAEMIQERNIVLAAVVGAVFTLLELRALITKGIKKQLKNPVFWQFIVLVGLAGVVMSQYVLYNNTLPTNTRYDFPAMLLLPLLNLWALRLVLSAIKKKRPKLYRPSRFLVYMAVVLLLTLVVVDRGYGRVREQAARNAHATKGFDDKLELMTEKLKQDDEVPLVIISSRYIDYEPVISIARHLRARGVINALALKYSMQTVSLDDPLGQNLNERMLRASEIGRGSEEGFGEFIPYAEYEECYAISFREPLTSECELLTVF